MQRETAKDIGGDAPVGFMIRSAATAAADLDNLRHALVDWITSMPSDELRAKLVEDGCDPDVDAEQCRWLFQQAAANARIP